MKLDKSKPYAETIGPSAARYHQDGRDFDASGIEIVLPIGVEWPGEDHPQDNADPAGIETIPPGQVATVAAKRKTGRKPKVKHDLEP